MVVAPEEATLRLLGAVGAVVSRGAPVADSGPRTASAAATQTISAARQRYEESVGARMRGVSSFDWGRREAWA
jgi:hypothetical protein